jgi:hypothetical protein
VNTEAFSAVSAIPRRFSPGRRLFAPPAFWVWGLMLAIALFSYYCHVLDEQVKRAKTFHTPVVSQDVASIAVLQTSTKPAIKRAARPVSNR